MMDYDGSDLRGCSHDPFKAMDQTGSWGGSRRVKNLRQVGWVGLIFFFKFSKIKKLLLKIYNH
jgi:hypothetical protein